jgi:DNA-binding XRE family transcriptional regulator
MKNITDFEDILKDKFGEKGTSSRDKYNADSLAYRLGVMLKEARNEAMITQDELAKRTEQKKVTYLVLREVKATFKSRHIIN